MDEFNFGKERKPTAIEKVGIGIFTIMIIASRNFSVGLYSALISMAIFGIIKGKIKWKTVS